VKPTRKQMIAAAKVAARMGGCTCQPDVTLYELAPGVTISNCAHDSWCKHGSCPAGCGCALCQLARCPAPTQPGGAA